MELLMLRRRQRGALIIAAIVLIVAVALMVVSLSFLTVANVGSSSLQEQSGLARFTARAGIEFSKQLFLTGTACNAAGLNTTQTVGSGSFTISGTTQYNASSATLSGALTAAATTIPVSSTTGYAPFGRIVIDGEEMYYGSISGNNFINLQRGTSNTVAAIHSAGAVVFQAVCNVTSTGTVGKANRVLQVNMPLQFYKTGVITKKNTAGAGTVGYTGIGFKPSVVIFFWTEQTATGVTAGGVGVSSGVGFAAATGTTITNYAAVTGMRDTNSTTHRGRSRSASKAVIFQTVTANAVPTLLTEANLQSMDVDGFTLNWSAPGDANAYRINYIALGGDTRGFVGNLNMGNVTGNQPVTGTGFQPDFVMFIHAADGATTSPAPNNTDSEFGIGFAQSPSARGAMVFASPDNLGTSATRWQQLTNKAILFLDHATNPPVARGQADLFSMDGNGFTINVTTASGAPAGTWNVGYLALRGARIGVGAFNEPAATGAQTPVSTLTFEPNGVMLASRSLVTGATLLQGRTSIGAAGGSTIANENIWFQDQDAAATANANAYNDATNIIAMDANANGVSPSPSQASLTSLQVGGFTLNWSARNSTREILYWAIGPRNYDDIKEQYP